MRISVFGLGYVGAVSAACLAAEGNTVVGVDTNPAKADLLNQGRAPVVEAGLGELIEEGVRTGRLRATTDCDAAVGDTDLAFVCVGTPSKGNGSLDLTYLRRVAGEIGQAIRHRRSPIVVVIRSTVLPGTTRQVLLPDLERAAGRPVAVAVYPEFLREGTAIRDYREPPKVVVGAVDDDESATWSPRWRRGRGSHWSRPTRSWLRWPSTPTTPGTLSRSPSPTRSAAWPRPRGWTASGSWTSSAPTPS